MILLLWSLLFSAVVVEAQDFDSGTFHIQFDPKENGFGKDARSVLLDALSDFETVFTDAWRSSIEAQGGSFDFRRFNFDVPTYTCVVVGCSEVQPPIPGNFPGNVEGTWVQQVDWSFSGLSIDDIDSPDADAYSAAAFADNTFTPFLINADSATGYFSTVNATEYLSTFDFTPDYTLVEEEPVAQAEILLSLRGAEGRYGRDYARPLSRALETFFSEKINDYLVRTIDVDGIILYGTRAAAFGFESNLVTGRIPGQYVEGRLGPQRFRRVVSPYNYTYSRHYWQRIGLPFETVQQFYADSIVAVSESFNEEDFVPYIDKETLTDLENVTEAVIVEPEDVPPPDEVPIEPPIEAPVDAPVDVPVESPVEAPVEAPVESPVDAPVEAPVEDPVESPVEPPVDPPVEPPTDDESEEEDDDDAGATTTAGFVASNIATAVAVVAAFLM